MAIELKTVTPTKAEVESAIKVADNAVLKLKSDIEDQKTKQEAEVAVSEETSESDDIENPFLNQEYEAEEESDADLDRPFDNKMESELDTEYNAEMEDTPDNELNMMMSSANVTEMSHLKVFALGRYRVNGGRCTGGNRHNGDDCISRATCRGGYVWVKCAMRGRGDGTYISYRGRHCYARGSWKGRAKAVAICESRRKWKHVIRRWSGRVRSGTATARCPRGWKALGCTGHSWWMKMRNKAGAFSPRGNRCYARVWGHRHFGAVYALCGKRNRSQRRPRRRRASTRRRPHPKGGKGNTKTWRGRGGKRSSKSKGGKNPLDEMERTLNRVDRSLRSMERQLKSIQRHR